MPNLPKYPDIGQNSNVDIFDFQISCQSHVKENFHNSRTSDDINMNLGPVTKLDKRNKGTSKKFDNDVISANCDIIVTFSIYGQSGAIQKPDSRGTVCKSFIFIDSNLSSHRN